VGGETGARRGAVLRVVLFVYDCARFALLLTLLRGNTGFVSVNALFPIMGFFLLVDKGKYEAYAPLYAAGKGLSVFSGLLWLVTALLARGVQGVFLKSPLFEPDWMAFFIVCTTVTDALSAVVVGKNKGVGSGEWGVGSGRARAGVAR
jgi:hypothetical protein